MKMNKKANKYHKFCIKYLCKYKYAKSAYIVAKRDKNINNDSHYKKALDELTEIGDIISTEKGWTINTKKYPIFADPLWRPIFKNNDHLVDMIFNRKKMTFEEWWSIFRKLSRDITSGYLKPIKSGNREINQISKSINKLIPKMLK